MTYEPYQLDQILSLLNDQLECLTIKSVMLELGLPRHVARKVLNDVVENSDNEGYDIVRMVPRSHVGGGIARTSIELVADGSSDSNGTRAKCSVFSIARVPPSHANDNAETNANNSSDRIQVLTAAHEKAIANQRYRFAENEEAELFEIFDNSGVDNREVDRDGDDESDGQGIGRIFPAPEVLCRNEEGISVIRRVKRVRNVSSVASAPGATGRKNGFKNGAGGSNSWFGNSSSASTGVVAASATSKGASKQKTTTADAFFGSAKVTSKPSEKNNKDKMEQNNASMKSGKNESKNVQLSQTSHETKESDKSDEANVGNADDFEGDIDEDDEFLQEEKARKARNASAARKEARSQMTNETLKRRNNAGMEGRRSKIAPEKRARQENESIERKETYERDEDVEMEMKDVDDVSEENNDNEQEEHKTIDAFAKMTKPTNETNSSKGGGGGAKKRRKKLIEHTTMDDNGYMRTETVAIWEDATDSEEEVETAGNKANGAKLVASLKRSMPEKSGFKQSAGNKPKKQAGLMGFFKKK